VSLKDLEERIKELQRQAEKKELQAQRDVNRLLPFFDQTKAIRRGLLLKSHARHHLSGYASRASNVSRKIVEDRNAEAINQPTRNKPTQQQKRGNGVSEIFMERTIPFYSYCTNQDDSNL
jgi:hypothetical protein